ncbi:oxidoreductase [Paracoccus acridae]|uniref:Oxidoreductase n=1 Tax=Paracoccus acridae TaxID=1795310 RepID=A0ABQ1VH28_9RHOB|nr:SDR family oxidoreductase [Paracoccus acridae]GGF66720.1 oxidoreductase [Paracoccus acridae]
MQNSGNTILLTGGTSGIGLALAQRFHAAGNTVIITGRRAALLDQIASEHPGMIGHPLDVTEAEAVRAFAARITADHPALNVVIHNAGIMVAEEVTGDFLNTAEATVATNLLGPIRLTAALMPHLLEQPRATIMTVSSGLAFVPLVRTPTYSATKAAIHSWSQSLRAQLRDTGIEVLELAPPAVQTDLMPGHATDPNAMPLADFIDEVMGILNQDPTPPLVGVKRLDFLKNAEAEGRYDQVFARLNGL